MSTLGQTIMVALIDAVCIFGMIYAPPKTPVSFVSSFFAITSAIWLTIVMCNAGHLK